MCVVEYVSVGHGGGWVGWFGWLRWQGVVRWGLINVGVDDGFTPRWRGWRSG